MSLGGLKVGDLVKIKEGFFNGQRAKIESISLKTETINLRLLDFRLPIPVVIRPEQVEKVEEENSNS